MSVRKAKLRDIPQETDNSSSVELAKGSRDLVINGSLFREYLGENATKDVYIRKYRIKEFETLIESNTTAVKCIERNSSVSVGLGFTEDTDKEIINNISVKELKLAQTNYEMFYEMFLEIKIYQRKALPVIYSIPSNVVHIGKSGKYLDQIVLNYGKKTEQLIPKFDAELYAKGIHPDGTYVMHVKKGYEVYGKPSTAQNMKLEMSKAFEESGASFYLNDAMPYLMMTFYGTPANSDNASKIKAGFETNLQGAKNHGKAFLNFIAQSKEMHQTDVTQITKTIAEPISLTWDNARQFAIASFYGVPSFMLNLYTAGKLGSTEEMQVQLNVYLQFEINPKREDWRDEVWSILYPDTIIEFNDIDPETILPTTQGSMTPDKVDEAVQVETEKAVRSLENLIKGTVFDTFNEQQKLINEIELKEDKGYERQDCCNH